MMRRPPMPPFADDDVWVRIPADAARHAGITSGTEVEILPVRGGVLVRPLRPPTVTYRYVDEDPGEPFSAPNKTGLGDNP